jgi:hypothetical protein
VGNPARAEQLAVAVELPEEAHPQESRSRLRQVVGAWAQEPAEALVRLSAAFMLVGISRARVP